MIRTFLKRFSKPALDPQTAEEILKEVFQLCGKEPNPTPTEILLSYRNYRQERYALQRHVLDIVLVLSSFYRCFSYCRHFHWLRTATLNPAGRSITSRYTRSFPSPG